MRRTLPLAGLLACAVLLPLVAEADWPMWGRDHTRNMTSEATGLLHQFDVGEFKGNTEEVDMATTRNIRWVAKLGSQTYGNPTVSGGRVFVGTNNESPRDERIQDDRGILYCLDEKTGKLLWQLACPKLGTGKVSDWEFLGIASSPAVEGNRVWIVTNRCEVMCLDVQGQANGNDGPFRDEGRYMAGPGRPPMEVRPTDADILWVKDMKEELGVFPHNITSCGPLIVGDYVVVTTSNGVDWTHTTIPNPRAPALAMYHKVTGELAAEEASGVSSRTLHSNWSSAAAGQVNGKWQVIFGGGDGWCYGYDIVPEKDAEGIQVFKELWKLDCNPPHYRMRDGKPIKYATDPAGPSEVIATPVFYKNRVYVPIGQDPEHGEGQGRMVCVDATKTGDIGKTGVIWSYDKIHRSLSTPSIVNGLVFVGDYSGYVHCLDAETGQAYWVYDTKSHIWGSTLAADGKVFIGTEDGDFVVLAADKTMKVIGKVDMKAPVYSSPVAANGTLFVATQTHLYAIGPTGAAGAAGCEAPADEASEGTPDPAPARRRLPRRRSLCPCPRVP